jgi:ABC-type Zn uptake system ZnuABC Zn-binding protein ZnuA
MAMSRILFCLGVLLFTWMETADAKVKVVATISDLASITEEVGGERVEVKWIANGKMDPHYVEILPSYMLMVKKAKLFVKVGLDLELWSFGVVDGARNRNLKIVDCSEGIEIMQKPTGRVSAQMGDIHVSGNPHYWLDPANGAIIARNIVGGLIEVDPEGAEYYQVRLDTFSKKLEAKISEWRIMMEPYQGEGIVFFHNSWPYFCRAFGFTDVGFVEPKPGINPSPGHTADIIQLIEARGIKTIAMAPYFSRKVPDSISRHTDSQVVVIASSVGGVEGADDYLSLFDVNLGLLKRALGGAP